MKPQILAAFVVGYMAGLTSMYNLVHLRDLRPQHQTCGGCIDANTSQAPQAVIQYQPGRREASLALESSRSSLSSVHARNRSVPTTRDVTMLSQTTWADERWSSPVFYRARTRRPAGSAQRHPNSFSQSGQDLTILKIFQWKKSGFFVDLAANDAASSSNTLMLEIEGDWQGWCLDFTVQQERERWRESKRHTGFDTESEFL